MARKILLSLSLLICISSLVLCVLSWKGLHFERITSSGTSRILRVTDIIVVNCLIVAADQSFMLDVADENVSPIPSKTTRWDFGHDFVPKYIGRKEYWIPSWRGNGGIVAVGDGQPGPEQIHLTIPLVPILILSAAYPLYLISPTYRRRQRNRLGRCLKCGYPLKNLPSRRCPECGEFGRSQTSDSKR